MAKLYYVHTGGKDVVIAQTKDSIRFCTQTEDFPKWNDEFCVYKIMCEEFLKACAEWRNWLDGESAGWEYMTAEEFEDFMSNSDSDVIAEYTIN